MTTTNLAPTEYRDKVASEQRWNQIVAWVKDIPPLPHVASQAISLVEDPDVSANRIATLLQKDPALAARVLKIANSAMFSFSRTITTLNQAIMIIGFKTLKGVIVAATLRQLHRQSGHIEEMIWKNSTCTAIGCQVISQHKRLPYTDECFLFGLLHDLGKLVLLRQIPDEYSLVIKKVSTGQEYYEAETEILGFNHSLIGALVAKKWNFSQDACQVILHHHDPLPEPLKEEMYIKAAIVQAANYSAHVLKLGSPDSYPEMDESMDSCYRALGVIKEDIPKILERIKDLSIAQESAL